MDYQQYNHNQDTNKTSAFNDAVFQIQRLNDIWTSCNRDITNEDLIKYKKNLKKAEIELIFDAKNITSKYRSDDDKNINYVSQIYELNRLIQYYEIKKNKYKLFNILTLKHALLREVQEKSGKGGKYRDEDEDDFSD